MIEAFIQMYGLSSFSIYLLGTSFFIKKHIFRKMLNLMVWFMVFSCNVKLLKHQCKYINTTFVVIQEQFWSSPREQLKLKRE